MNDDREQILRDCIKASGKSVVITGEEDVSSMLDGTGADWVSIGSGKNNLANIYIGTALTAEQLEIMNLL